MILIPEVAFTGDTTSDFILDPRNSDALRAKVLITEVNSTMCNLCDSI
jgi:ribonuclease Z